MKKIVLLLGAITLMTATIQCAPRERISPTSEKALYEEAKAKFEFALRMGRGEIFGIGNDYGAFLKALDEAESAIDDYLFLHPQGNHAREVSLLKARLYDIYLRQKFDRALEYYQKVVENYPDTEEAEYAKSRIEHLRSIQESLGTGSHGIYR